MKTLKNISLFVLIALFLSALFVSSVWATEPDVDNDASWNEIEGENGTFLLGDSTGDGKVNSVDVTFIRRYIAGGYDVTIVEEASDINKDGKINSVDITLLRRYIAGGYPEADAYWETVEPEEPDDENDGWTEGIYRP